MTQDIEYVDVQPHHQPSTFFERWIDQSSAKHASPELIAADALRRLYTGYSLVVSEDHRLSGLLTLPGVTVHASDSAEAASKPIINVTFSPASVRNAGRGIGSLVDNIIFGSYKITWNVRTPSVHLGLLTSVEKENEFIVHITKFQVSNIFKVAYFILHDGPEQPVRDLVLAVALYAEKIHDEVWVFNQNNWSKNKQLWLQIKDSSWDDVVMKEVNKVSLKKDVYGFFKSEMTYKKLSIPWKRGLILYGPPGNGKTISIKVIMKTCTERGFTPLYVRSFKGGRIVMARQPQETYTDIQGFQGEEGAMQNVFLKTRQLAPCVLILEDLDSLINDANRSFFLNQLDGIEGNDGLLVIASTNHFDKLDPGLSNRPSRFDRKYLFDDPDHPERVLYAKYWQEKLKDKDEIFFPESLVDEVAELTQGFSFAYLKEAFVATLVRITNTDGDKQVAFPVVLKSQIMTLRKELGNHIPSPAIPQPGQGMGERTLPVKPSLVQEGNLTTQRLRDLGQLPLPTDAPSTEFDVSDNSFSSPMTQSTYNIHGNVSRLLTRAPERTARSDKPIPQGYVLHAPPSAYPQVMPGSLPSPNPDRLQGPICAAQHGASVANTGTGPGNSEFKPSGK